MIMKDIRQEYLDFLYSHIEWEHIEQDAEDTYGTSELEALDVDQLQKLSSLYGFDDNEFGCLHNWQDNICKTCGATKITINKDHNEL